MVKDAKGDIGVANDRELSVVGLDYDKDNQADKGDRDAEPTPVADLEPNTRQHTENKFREELGIELRQRY